MANFNFYISSAERKETAKDLIRGSWKLCAKTTLIYFLISLALISCAVFPSIFVYWWLSIPIGLFALLIISILNYGYNKFCLDIAQNKQTGTSQLFAGFSKKMGAVIATSIKKFFLSIFWLILLIVPYIIKNIGYSMAHFLIADRADINGSNALSESKHIMTQNYGRYTKFALSYFGWFLLGSITGGIAMIWILPLFNINRAVFYENLKTEF